VIIVAGGYYILFPVLALKICVSHTVSVMFTIALTNPRLFPSTEITDYPCNGEAPRVLRQVVNA